MSRSGDEDVYQRAPGRHAMLTRARIRAILRMAPEAGETKARQLYEEMYGATPGSTLTLERVRASLVEACNELLDVDVQ